MLPASASKRGSVEDDDCLSRLGTLICRRHRCPDPKDYKQERTTETESGFKYELTVRGFGKDGEIFVGYGASIIEAKRNATRQFVDDPTVRHHWNALETRAGDEKEFKKQRCG